jgi:uncharacterized repeat protein (TIGR03803 family)
LVISSNVEATTPVLTNLYSFGREEAQSPLCTLVQQADGSFVGTSNIGGASGYGEIFTITPSGTMHVLHQVDISDGGISPPSGVVRGTDGNYYGILAPVGNSNGVFYRILPDGSFTRLYEFAGSNVPSSRPVLAPDGNFYGTVTLETSTTGNGAVYRMTPAGVFTIIYNFAGTTDGGTPVTDLTVGSDGLLYGVTSKHGGHNDGTIFKMTLAGTLTVLHDFTVASDHGPLVEDTDHNFYGVADLEGTTGSGAIYQLTPAGTYTVIYSFPRAPGNFSYYPMTALTVGPGGDLYGSTEGGGPSGFGFGVLFKVTTAGTYTQLHELTAADGGSIGAGLCLASDGNFYGNTMGQTGHSNGSFFSITPSGTFTILHIFASNDSDGDYPASGLLKASDGNFYGTTKQGGATLYGTIFRVTTAGVRTTLHVFALNASEGITPTGPLIQASDGAIYGTTSAGGVSAAGTVYKMALDGTFTVLHRFTETDPNDGKAPLGGIIQASDGNFYGTTSLGGANLDGTAFKMTSAGVVTVIHSFDANVDGSIPEGALVQASDTNLYGTTSDGGTDNVGTIFRLTTSGAVTVIHQFDSNGDGSSSTGLVQGNNGNLYGTSRYVPFQISLAGSYTAYPFLVAPGSSNNGFGPLIKGSDGNFYGTVQAGFLGNGISGSDGFLFEMTPAGVSTALHFFNGLDGGGPNGPMVQTSDGSFYGATTSGGFHSRGSIFKLGFATLTSSAAYSVVHDFSVDHFSSGPQALLQNSAGTIYGRTTNSVFRLNSDGSTTTLTTALSGTTAAVGFFADSTNNLYASDGHSLYTITAGGATLLGTVPYPDNPTSCIIKGSDGALYLSGVFAIYRYSASGGFTTFCALSDVSTMGQNVTSIVQGTDGAYYALALTQGGGGCGTVFRVAADGTYTLIHTFTLDESNDSVSSTARLLLARDGNLYGFIGTAFFKISAAGVYTLLHKAGIDDGNGINSLIQGSDNAFYGTTDGDGILPPDGEGRGTVFRVTSSGDFTVLHVFDLDDGDTPCSLIQGSDGAFYGTASHEGETDLGYPLFSGSVFRVTSAGAFTLLHVQTAADGAFPAGLIQTSDGTLYGYAENGGYNASSSNHSSVSGTLFKLTLTTQPPNFSSASAVTFVTGQLNSFTVHASGSPAPTYSATGLPSWAALDAQTGVLSGTPPDTTGSPFTITVTASNGTSPDAVQTLHLTVVAPQSFSAWETAQGISGSEKTVLKADGIPNLLKYVFHIDPTKVAGVADQAALPKLDTDTLTQPGTTYLTLTYRQYARATGVTMSLQQSTDLVNWTTVTPDVAGPVGVDATTGDPIMEMGIAVTQPTRIFLRLKVTTP